MMFALLRRMFGKRPTKQEPVVFVESPEDIERRRRDNAAIYVARSVARKSLDRGDATGAVLDMVRVLRERGYGAPWLEIMAAGSFGSLDKARGFVEGFALNEEAAEQWLKENAGNPAGQAGS